ncbi:thioredoxin family protein [Candidatus Dependentiae bacterium]|nr:thioredoxin family protein [Candidatus Dependentiae bacterium]
MKKYIVVFAISAFIMPSLLYSTNALVQVQSIEEFDNIIKKSLQPVVAQFHSGCPICNATREHVKEVMLHYSDVRFLEIDINKVPNLTERYSITALPTVLIFEPSCTQPAYIITGPTRDDLDSKIKKVLLEKK